jgi:drug/metabolite transporter (DMT)-like permease
MTQFDPKIRFRANLAGMAAVLLWASLAALTVLSQPVPPFLLNALTFAVGGALGVVWLVTTGQGQAMKSVPLAAYLMGITGLFGYHALYFSALRMAPPAEASLIAYFWPLFIVLFSGLLPGENLRAGHILGAGIAFLGAAVLVTDGGQSLPSMQAMPGLALAFLCALTWAAYSLASRALGKVPTAAVVVYCIATAVLSAGAHLLVEDTVWTTNTIGLMAILGLGLGPVGAAFFLWDHGMKRGDVQFLGAAAYAAPLLSTILLVVTGQTTATPTLGIAAVLITLGAVLAHRAGRQPVT